MSWISGPCDPDEPPPTVISGDACDPIDALWWPLTQQAIDLGEEMPLDLGEGEPVRGNALLRQMAAESDGRMVEIEPGRFYVEKD